MVIYAGGPPNLRGIKYFDLLFATIIHLPNPTFVPSLSEIGDLSCIVSISCLVLTQIPSQISVKKKWTSTIERLQNTRPLICIFPSALNKTLITIHPFHMLISERVFCNLAVLPEKLWS